MKFNFFQKVLLILTLLFLVFLYGQYERKKFYGEDVNQPGSLVLKELPEFKTTAIESGSLVSSKELLSTSNGLFVHIWGSWCAPCEKEMPEFLTYAQSLESKGIKFLLVAVNDEAVKVKKFLTRFPNVPKNVTFAIDKDNVVMDLFGTLKVPETFLFNKVGKHINKFVGPQDWVNPSYQTRLDFWLSGQPSSDRKIETH